jgi:hypothetical protein
MTAKFGRAAAAALIFSGLAIGCRTGTLTDPNEVRNAGITTPEVVRTQIESAAWTLNERKAKGEINDRQYHALLTKIAEDYVDQAKEFPLTTRNAATWGSVLITAKRWKEAEKALEVAIQSGKGPSQRDYLALGDYMTNVLRLALVEAELGKVPQAVRMTVSVFDVPGKAKAPILPAVLYEIVPAGSGKGYDLELAHLLKSAIGQHEAVIVNPNTDAGRNFLLARPHHIRRAWNEAALLYSSSGRQDLARDAIIQGERSEDAAVRL